MSDKPKRSEIVNLLHQQLRLRWSAFLYALCVIPTLINMRYVLPTIFMLLIGIGSLWIGSYVGKLLSKWSKNLVVKLVILLLEVGLPIVIGGLFIIPALLGTVKPLLFYSSPSAIFSAALKVLEFILIMIAGLVSYWLVFGIHALITDFMITIPNSTLEKQKRKNVATENANNDFEKPDISAESESAIQKMK